LTRGSSEPYSFHSKTTNFLSYLLVCLGCSPCLWVPSLFSQRSFRRPGFFTKHNPLSTFPGRKRVHKIPITSVRALAYLVPGCGRGLFSAFFLSWCCAPYVSFVHVCIWILPVHFESPRLIGVTSSANFPLPRSLKVHLRWWVFLLSPISTDLPESSCFLFLAYLVLDGQTSPLFKRTVVYFFTSGLHDFSAMSSLFIVRFVFQWTRSGAILSWRSARPPPLISQPHTRYPFL